jgi:hypothetical protein
LSPLPTFIGSGADQMTLEGRKASRDGTTHKARMRGRVKSKQICDQCWAGAEMNARMLGIICALLAAMPNLIGCESSRSYDYQFEKQVKRAQECRQLQDKLVGDQTLMPERGEEIANTMAGAGCTARLPSAAAGLSPRFPA